jgi:hypothetical protein
MNDAFSFGRLVRRFSHHKGRPLSGKPPANTRMRTAYSPLFLLLLLAVVARAEDEFERPPIGYSLAMPENPVSRLLTRLERGEETLPFDAAGSYLPALLKSLGVPVESQMLVFSKTSMQRNRIAPRTPRAIYFNDDVYIGFCHASDTLEISVADPALGAVFYTLEQNSAAPALVRKTQDCLLCHSSSQVGGVPSHLVRSVYPDASGLPMLAEGSFRVDHATPLDQRWGGWYVTGTHGGQIHLGNLSFRESPLPRPVRNETGLNLVNLGERFPTRNYLTPHSDIVALMVLEHQTMVHNLITQANYTTRQALAYEAEFNRALGEPADNRLESTTRRIASAGERLVRGLLFVDEAPLTSPIAGTSGFSAKFVEAGPRDKLGRSLRDFDLNTRMFKFPCSYLIYSAAFDGMPREMKDYVAGRLRQVLGASPNERPTYATADDLADFAKLSVDDRRALVEILRDTKPEVLIP